MMLILLINIQNTNANIIALFNLNFLSFYQMSAQLLNIEEEERSKQNVSLEPEF